VSNPTPEELQYQLTLGQVYSALAYYADHLEKFEREIEVQLRHVDQMKKSSRPSPLLKRLQSLKLIAKAGELEDLENRVEYLPL
jgi:hypothetical protein